MNFITEHTNNIDHRRMMRDFLDRKAQDAVEASAVEASAVEVDTASKNHISRGRQSDIPEDLFIQAINDAASMDDVIARFPKLAAMEVKKARQYVSVRASAVRKRVPELKQFKRGRKAL